MAIVSYIYNHQLRQMSSRPASAQSRHHCLILATQYVYLDYDTCLVAIMLRGPNVRGPQLRGSLIAERDMYSGAVPCMLVALEVSRHESDPYIHLHRPN